MDEKELLRVDTVATQSREHTNLNCSKSGTAGSNPTVCKHVC